MALPLTLHDLQAAFVSLNKRVKDLELRRSSSAPVGAMGTRPAVVKTLRQTSGTLDLTYVQPLVSDSQFDPSAPSLVSLLVSVTGATTLVANTTTTRGASFEFDSLPFHIPDTSVTFDGTTADLVWNDDPIVDVLGEDIVPGAGTSRIDQANYQASDFPGVDGSWYRPPHVALYLYDGNVGLPPSLSADLDLAVVDFDMDGVNDARNVSWTFGQGTPEVTVLVTDPDNQYPGTYSVDVLARVVQFT